MRILKNVDHQFWLAVAQKCEYATFFHTPYWHRLAIQSYSNYHDLTLGAELESGVRAVIPLLETKPRARGLLRNFVSTFAGCYGGLIADGPVTQAERQALYQALLEQHRFGRLQIVENPLLVEGEELRQGKIRQDFTQLLPLEAGYEQIFSKFSKGHKSSTKKGRRMGVTTRLAQTLADYQAYFAVYEALHRAWGERATSQYPWQLFEQGYYLAQKAPEQIKLWLAEQEGKVIGGVLVFYWNRHGVGWHAASQPEYSAFCPGNVLYADIIQDACERGYHYYDFNPSGGHDGVVSFKKSFGSEARPINRYIFSNPLDRTLRQILDKAVELKNPRL